MKEKLLVSACLLGIPCRYNGETKKDEPVCAMADRYELVPVCPEVLGGLKTPREPSEIRGRRVYTKSGEDVTGEYEEGARRALIIAMKNGCKKAVLKEKSPSCGSGLIHNGLFDGGLVPGDGVTARFLKIYGMEVYGETEIDNL